jgi:hypothetical protein
MKFERTDVGSLVSWKKAVAEFMGAAGLRVIPDPAPPPQPPSHPHHKITDDLKSCKKVIISI